MKGDQIYGKALIQSLMSMIMNIQIDICTYVKTTDKDMLKRKSRKDQDCKLQILPYHQLVPPPHFSAI